jgi:hypothetical protein
MPVHAGHPDVHEHDGRVVALGEFECLGAVAGFGDHPQVGSSAEHPDHLAQSAAGAGHPPPSAPPVARIAGSVVAGCSGTQTVPSVGRTPPISVASTAASTQATVP